MQSAATASPKPLEIFAAGTHTASNGEARAWSTTDLGAIAAAYDPAVFEAPIVVGHPKVDSPAFGWIKGLAVQGTKLVALPGQVNADFAGLVKAGTYKKISASFWPPGHPANPKPEGFYLRHVGFLGGHEPAVKGLRAAEFAGGEDGVLTFAGPPLSFAIEPWSIAAAFDTCARLFRGWREKLIASEGQEAADKQVPNWDLESLANAASRLRESDAADAAPAYAAADTPHLKPEQTSDHGGSDVTLEQKAAFEADQAKLKADREAHDKKVAEFAARKAADEKAADEDFLDGLVKQGRVLPVEKADLVLAFAAIGGGTYDFAADSEQGKGRAALRKVLAVLPARVPLREAAGATGQDALDHAGGGDAVAIAGRILDEKKKAAERGESITDAAALARVQKGV